jgi:hypothetical protein
MSNITNQITPEDFLHGKTVTIIEEDTIPALGTPHRASWEANHASGEEAKALHGVAEQAWNGYTVHSFGGAMLRQAKINYHASRK